MHSCENDSWGFHIVSQQLLFQLNSKKITLKFNLYNMQRWSFVDEDCEAVTCPSSSTFRSTQSIEYDERQWSFKLLVNSNLCPNEKIAITGECAELGNWKPNNCVLMQRDGETNYWSATVKLPRDKSIKYRYFVCASDQSTEKIIVRRWETHLEPRSIPEFVESQSFSEDAFGVLNGFEKVDRGWLTWETIVQLKFFNAPFTWKQRIKKRLLHIKVTPMTLKIHCEAENPGLAGTSVSTLEDSLSSDTHDTRENGGDSSVSSTFGFAEVTTLNCDESMIQMQPQFGTVCSKDNLVIFHLTVGDFESTAYLIDLYTYSSKAAYDEPPYHFGYHYILPNVFKRSEGRLEIPVTCATKHRPLGMMQVGYLIVKPFQSCSFDMQISYQRYWNRKWTGLDVGHRGSGTSFKAKDTVIRENTITSLKNAVAHGADMVEFDVQLSKDLVPVVYHDFMVYVSLKKKNHMQEHDFLEMPMRELTLEQLKNLQVYHTAEGRSGETRSFHNDDLLEHQPFPQLEDVLDAIDPFVGFNIEIKWSQRLEDGTMEEEFEHVIDRNLYVDCILDVVFRKSGCRRIVFSCFDPDICTMLRFKQNRYPVMFLTIGVSTKYKKYLDPRGNRISTAVCNSLAMELLGIVAHSEDLLRDPSQANFALSRGLILFCWGDDNNNKDTIKILKDLGLHAIIYDKLDVLTPKENKQSVFLVQAKESQSDLLKMQCLEMGKKWGMNKENKEICEQDNIGLEPEHCGNCLSTTTSLSNA